MTRQAGRGAGSAVRGAVRGALCLPLARQLALQLALLLLGGCPHAGSPPVPPRLGGAAPALGAGHWNPVVHGALERWLSRLARRPAEQQLVLMDCDNTAWAGDIADAVLPLAAPRDWSALAPVPGIALPASTPGERLTPLDYYEALHRHDALAAYRFVSVLFAGQTLAQVQRALERASRRPDFPKPYDEVRQLTRVLSARGITVGYVSASPLFLVAPMLERSHFPAPLWAVEGVDAYVEDPRRPGHELSLTNLVQSEGLTRWSQVLARHGTLRLSARGPEITNAREGKALGGSSIAARHVWRQNVRHPGRRLSLAQLTLVGVLGDNFGTFADLPGSAPREVGNDHGLLRALRPDPELLLFNLYRARRRPGGLDLAWKRVNHRRFHALARQLRRLGLRPQVVEQLAVAAGVGRGLLAAPAAPAPGTAAATSAGGHE